MYIHVDYTFLELVAENKREVTELKKRIKQTDERIASETDPVNVAKLKRIKKMIQECIDKNY